MTLPKFTGCQVLSLALSCFLLQRSSCGLDEPRNHVLSRTCPLPFFLPHSHRPQREHESQKKRDSTRCTCGVVRQLRESHAPLLLSRRCTRLRDRDQLREEKKYKKKTGHSGSSLNQYIEKKNRLSAVFPLCQVLFFFFCLTFARGTVTAGDVVAAAAAQPEKRQITHLLQHASSRKKEKEDNGVLLSHKGESTAERHQQQHQKRRVGNNIYYAHGTLHTLVEASRLVLF